MYRRKRGDKLGKKEYLNFNYFRPLDLREEISAESKYILKDTKFLKIRDSSVSLGSVIPLKNLTKAVESLPTMYLCNMPYKTNNNISSKPEFLKPNLWILTDLGLRNVCFD